MTPPERLELLKTVVEFRGLPRDALSALAEVMTPRPYPRLPRPWLLSPTQVRLPSDWYAPRFRSDPNGAWIHPPLRLTTADPIGHDHLKSIPIGVVGVGEIRLIQRRRGRTYERTLGPGTLFGEQGVVAVRHDGPPRGIDSDALDISVAAVGRTVILEAPTTEVDRLGRDFPPLFDALQAGFDALVRAPELVDVLKRSRILSAARRDDLFALTEGLKIQTCPDQAAIDIPRGDEPPEHFCVVLRGDVSRTDDRGRRYLSQDPVIGLRAVAERRPFTAEVRSVGEVEYVQVPASRFDALQRLRPHFGRAVRSAASAEAERARAAAKNLEAADVILILGPYASSRLWGPLADLAGEALATHLYDRTCVLHLLREGPVPEDVTLSLPAADPRYPGVRTKLRHTWMVVGSDAVSAVDERVGRILAQLDGRDGQRAFDAVVIDPSGLPGDRPMAFVDLDRITTIGYVLPSSRASVPERIIQRRVELVPIGLLAGAGTNVGSFGRFLLREYPRERLAAGGAGTEGGSELDRPRQLAGATPLVPRVREASGYLAAHLRRGVKELAQKLAEPHLVGEGAYAAKPPWPPKTVRVRLMPEHRDQLAGLSAKGPRPIVTLASIDADDRLQGAVFRLGRGLTGRRVGVALGGGGAFGYVHAALLLALGQSDAQVPIDILSGSSFGTVVGTYYAAGDTDFELLCAHPGFMRAAVFAGVVTTASMSFAIDLELGPVDLNDLDVTLLPTVTDGDTGLEGTIRRGTIGYGVRASGSLPPFAPTIEGARRHLDGGLAANVPVQILDDEGAGLIISSNPIPEPSPLPRSLPLPIPGLGPFLKMSNPLARANDTFRSTLTLMRAASSSQEAFAHVRYRAQTHGKTMFDFSRREDIIRDAMDDPEQRLTAAVAAAADAWRGLLRHPPARVLLVERPYPALMTPNVVFRIVGARIDVARVDVLSEVADVIRASPKIKRVEIGVDAAALPGRARHRFGRQASVRVRQLLIDHGVSPDRLVIGPNRRLGPERAVDFRVDLDEPVAADRFEDVRARLVDGAKAALAESPPDRRLARLLAIEAAGINLLDPAVLNLLRAVLEVPVRLIREWPDDGGPAAYCPTEDCLAVAVGPGTIEIVGRPARLIAPYSQGRIVDLAWGPSRQLAAAIDGPEGGVAAWPWGSETPHVLKTAGARAVAFVGDRIVVTDDEGVAVWPAIDGAAAVRLDHPGARAAVVSRDGSSIVTLGADRRAGLWDADGNHRRWLGSPRQGPLAGAFSPAGRLAIAAGRRVVLWPDLDGEAVTLSAHRRDVVALAWSHDGRVLATAGLDGKICLWNAHRGALMDILRPPRVESPAALAFHPRRRSLAFMTTKQFHVWSADTGLVEAAVGDLRSDVRHPRLSWRRDGERIALSDGATREVGFKETVELDHDGEPIRWAAWAPRSPNAEGADQWAAFTTTGGQLTAWNPTNRVHRSTIFDSTGIPIIVAWHPSGRWLTVARGPTLISYDLLSGTFGRSLALDRPVHAMAWSPENQLFVRFDTRWSIVRMDGDRLFVTYEGQETVSDIVVNRTGDRLALLMPGTGARIAALDTVGDAVFPLASVARGGVTATTGAWSDDGALALVIEGTASVWRPNHGLSAVPIEGPVRGLTFCPHHAGPLALATDDRVAVRSEQGDLEVLVEAPGAIHGPIAWSPDGRRLAVGDRSGQIRTWIDGAGIDAGVIEQREPIVGLAWRPDGRRLMSWAKDAKLRVHLVDPDDLLQAVGRFSVEARMKESDWDRWMSWTGEERRDSWPIVSRRLS